MIDIKNGKFIHAYFADKNKKGIKAVWKDNETLVETEVVIMVDLTSELYNKLLEDFSIDDIVKMTNLKLENEKAAYIRLVKQIALDSGLLYNPDAAVEKSQLNIDHIFTPPEGDAGIDLLFNIKLKIFDMEQVINSTNTELKKQLRQSKTPLEALWIAGKFLFE